MEQKGEREEGKGRVQIFQIRNKSGHFLYGHQKVTELCATRIGDLDELNNLN